MDLDAESDDDTDAGQEKRLDEDDAEAGQEIRLEEDVDADVGQEQREIPR